MRYTSTNHNQTVMYCCYIPLSLPPSIPLLSLSFSTKQINQESMNKETKIETEAKTQKRFQTTCVKDSDIIKPTRWLQSIPVNIATIMVSHLFYSILSNFILSPPLPSWLCIHTNLYREYHVDMQWKWQYQVI